MNGKRMSRWGWIAVSIVAPLTLGVSYARAGATQLFVTLTGTGVIQHTVHVSSVTGGTVSGGKSVSTPSGVMTTASINVPLVVTCSEADPDLLKFAAVEIANPNAYQSPALKAQTFDEVTPKVFKVTQEQQFQKVVPYRVDIPGSYGSASQHGPFVVTANVISQQTSTSTNTPAQSLPSSAQHAAYPAYWVVHLDGFSNGKKELPQGFFTFEPFSLSAKQTTLALTLHSDSVTLTDLSSWAKAHPNGQASVEWVQTGSVKTTRYFMVALNNVALGATTNDATGQPAITAHLTGTINQIDAP